MSPEFCLSIKRKMMNVEAGCFAKTNVKHDNAGTQCLSLGCTHRSHCSDKDFLELHPAMVSQ